MFHLIFEYMDDSEEMEIQQYVEYLRTISE